MHTTPALVAAAAARALPRPALIIGCALYVCFGFIAREPWRETELAYMGLALELARTVPLSWNPGSWSAAAGMAWLRPSLLGLLPSEHGPLVAQLGALLFQALPFVAPDLLWRGLGMALLCACLLCTRQGIFYLARHPLAQPLPFAIGGEASPLAYARAIADTGLLAFVASFGLIQPTHETTPLLMQFTLWCVGFYALAVRHVHPRRAMLGLMIASLGLIFAGWPLLGLLLLLGALGWSHLSVGVSRQWRLQVLGLLLLWCIVYAALLSGWFSPRSAGLYSLALFENFTLDGLNLLYLGKGLRTLLWFTWPLLPMALLALWRWRALLWRSSHLVLPLCVTLVGLALAILFRGDGYDHLDGLLLALPGLAALAAFGVLTLTRSAVAALDWFALLLATGLAIAIWGFWAAIHTGWPTPLARNVAKLVPGFGAQWQALPWLIGLALSLAWGALVVWRGSRLRKPLWKTYALSAGGTLLGMGLLSSLFFPVLNYARSYQPWVAQLDKVLLYPSGRLNGNNSPTRSPHTAAACIQVQGLTLAQITALQHYRNTAVERAGPNSRCTILLLPREHGLVRQNSLEHRRQNWQWRGHLRLATRRDKDKDDIWVYTRP